MTERFTLSSVLACSLLALALVSGPVFAQTPTVTVVNTTRGGSDFVVGDSVQVIVTGPPSATVTYARSVNGIVLDATPPNPPTQQNSAGSIPSMGPLVINKFEQLTLVGHNTETWCIGGTCMDKDFDVVPLVPRVKEYIRVASRVIAMENVTPALPVQQVVNPSPAIGTTNLRFVIQDINSPASSPNSSDVTNAGILIHRTFDGASACYFQINFSTLDATLIDDDGINSHSMSAASLSPTNALSNSQCTLTRMTSLTSGNLKQWSADLTFATGYADGIVYSFAQTSTGQSEWSSVTQWYPAGSPPPLPATKVGLFRSGYFWILDANGNEAYDGNAPGLDRAFPFGGIAGDIPITGDWNGDGRTKIGIYRSGTFLLDYDGDGLLTANDKSYAFFVTPMVPMVGDIPVIGNWNGDGKSKVGIYRSGTWYVDFDGDGAYTTSGSDRTYTFGLPILDVPVVGDWTGSGRSQIGVVRSGFLWILDSNGNGVIDGGDTPPFPFGGIPGDVPVVGDWNNDGKSKVGVFRGGFFWILDANNNHAYDGTGPGNDIAFPFGGIVGDLPQTGRF